MSTLLRRSPALRSAAVEFGRLPELADARRLLAARDIAGALSNVRRAAEVVEAVPMPPLRMAACGALAQLLRAAGRTAEEAATWDAAMSLTDGDKDLRLHAINGATACALHRAEPAAALAFCENALCDAVTLPWRGVFGLHRSLAHLQLPVSDPGSPSTAINGVLLDMGELGELDKLGDDDARDESAFAHASLDGIRMHLGDAHALCGDDAAARVCWSAMLAESADTDEAAAEAGDESGNEAASTAAHASSVREVLVRCRLGRSLLAAGEIAPDGFGWLGMASDCH